MRDLSLDVAMKWNAEVRRGEIDLASGRGAFFSSAEPDMLCSYSAASVKRRVVRRGLSCLLAFQLVFSGFSFAAQVEAQEVECPSMLMGFECAMYQQRLKLAASEAQRDQVVAEYAQIQNERHRVCPVTDKATLRAAKVRSVQR